MTMYFGDTHTSGRVDFDMLEQQFDDEIDGIAAFHRYSTQAVVREFSTAYERLLLEHNPEFESYDGGDAIYDAEKELGVNPWDTERHVGLMSLGRAVALAEIVLARVAAACWERPDLLVFPKGRTWPREWEREFYRTCLQKPFNTNSNGFGEIREIRDLYAHGYGVPVTREAQERLAARLHSKFDFSPPSATEIALGYSGVASFFGETATYDAKEGLRDPLMMRLPAANLTPVATHRALDRLRTHVHRAVEAVRGGIRDDYRQSKYIKTVVRWWEKNGGTPED